MSALLLRNHLLRMICLLVLVFGQAGHAPDRLVVPQAHGQLLGDSGAHVPIVQVRAMHVVARAEVGEGPSERPALPILPQFQFDLPNGEPSSGRSTHTASQPTCEVGKGFWACGPPLQLG